MPRRGNISALYELAAGQWGMFTSAQALRVGTSRNQLSRMVADGRLEPMVYGVYRVTAGESSPHAMVRAAWLSIYPGLTAYERLSSHPFDAVVTGNTAACVYGFGDFYESPYCLAVVARKRTTRSDLLLLSSPVEERDVSREFDVPVATIERVVADLVRFRVDPSLLGGFLTDAAYAGRSFDGRRLAELLEPLARANGFEDGAAFASELIEGYVVPAVVRGSTGRIFDALESTGPTGNREKILGDALDAFSGYLRGASDPIDAKGMMSVLELFSGASGIAGSPSGTLSRRTTEGSSS